MSDQPIGIDESPHQWELDMAIPPKQTDYDKRDPRNLKQQWQAIIKDIQNQLPSEYRRLTYVGRIPPIKGPLFSRKRSDEIQRAHLFFGRHKHDPEGRIEVQIGRRGPYEWKVLALSLNPVKRESTLPTFKEFLEG